MERQPSTRSWKGEEGAAAAFETVDAGPPWRQAAAVHRRLRARDAAALVAGSAAFVILFSILLWALSWWHPSQGTQWHFVGAGYQNNLAIPHNVFGWNSLIALADWENDATGRDEPLKPFIPNRESFKRWSDSLADGNGNLVVYLSLHGASDSNGAYVLPADAAIANDAANRIRLADIVAALAALSANRTKVLVLDCTSVESNWQLGVLHNGFARELADLDDQIVAVPNLIVLCASGPGERSWPCYSWGESVFGHFLRLGLEGGADRNRNERVDAFELFEHTRGSVASWAKQNRGAGQIPIMLPSGAEGERRARRIELAVVDPKRKGLGLRELAVSIASGRSAAPPERAHDRNPPTIHELDPLLRAAWGQAERLAQATPSPTVYAPELWRRYRDLLIRYEQLLLAADANAAGAWLDELAEIEPILLQGRTISLGSMTNSLTMPAAAGILHDSFPDSAATFHKLWNSPPQEVAEAWKAAIQGRSAQEIDLLRLGVFRSALDQVVQSPRNLSKSSQVVDAVADAVRSLPTELHFLVMLNRDLPKPLPDGEIQIALAQALEVHRLGEETVATIPQRGASYCETLLPLVRPLIDEADAKRRIGEDLLFGAEVENWREARTLVGQARDGYLAAEKQSETLRSALAARDAAFAMMPYYAVWKASRLKAPDKDSDPPGGAESVSLWEQARILDATLGRMERDRARGVQGDSIEQLAKVAEAVLQGATRIEDEYVSTWTSLTSSESPDLVRQAEQALAVPFLRADFRVQLIDRMLAADRNLAANTTLADPYADVEAPAQDKKMLDAVLREQGRIALEVLGADWFDACAREGSFESFDQVLQRLDSLDADSDWSGLARAGDEIGVRWAQLPGFVEAAVRSVRTHDDSLDRLEAGASLASGLVAAVPSNAIPAPSDLLRRLRIGRLLEYQAQRAIDDHWAARETIAEPYYRVVGLSYVADAAGVLPKYLQPKTAMPIETQLALPGNLVISGPQSIDITSEQRRTLEYQVSVPMGSSVPPGRPVLSASIGPDLVLESPVANRRAVRTIAAERAPILACTLSTPLVDQAERDPALAAESRVTNATVEALYRGHRSTLQTTITISPVADSIQRKRLAPNRSSIAVHADPTYRPSQSSNNASVTIVIDCSGSMGSGDEPFSPAAKYAEATAALRQLLREIPPSTMVSVWIFGQALGPEKTVAEPERTIIPVLASTIWDPADASQLEALMARIVYPAVEPWNESPVIRAMLTAKADLDNVAGFKSLIVVTDGMDNRFEKDAAYNPQQKSIGTALVESFADTGIEVNVIGFKVESHEEDMAREQFLVIEKLPVPGKWYTAEDSAALIEALRQAIRPKSKCLLEREDGIRPGGVPADGIDISRPGANLQWLAAGLTPGEFFLRLPGAANVKQSVFLDRGELLLVKVLGTSEGPRFARSLFSAENYSWKPARVAAGWRLALLQNELSADQSAQMLLTVEKSDGVTAPTIRQERPNEILIEVTPQLATAREILQRYAEEPGYPASAWSIDLPKWPLDAKTGQPVPPVIRAWWSPTEPTPPASLLVKGHNFQDARDIKDRTLRIENDDVVIEGIAFEEHIVETTPGQRESKQCLVARVRHAVGKPVWIGIDGALVIGHEHRTYSQVGRYTGLFWPISASQADQVREIRVYSVAQSKRAAEARGTYIQMTDVGVPSVNDMRPQKPVELR